MDLNKEEKKEVMSEHLLDTEVSQPQPEQEKKPNNYLDSFLFLNLHTFMLTVANAGSKDLQLGGVSTIDLLFFRYFILLFISYFTMVKMGQTYMSGCTSVGLFLKL